jgi:hypothetical protein
MEASSKLSIFLTVSLNIGKVTNLSLSYKVWLKETTNDKTKDKNRSIVTKMQQTWKPSSIGIQASDPGLKNLQRLLHGKEVETKFSYQSSLKSSNFYPKLNE